MNGGKHELTHQHIAIGFMAALIAGAGIGYYFGYDAGWKDTVAKILRQQTEKAAIANPASANCVRLGGTLEIVNETNGQVGYCHLKDGRVCEEWSLMRGGCTFPK